MISVCLAVYNRKANLRRVLAALDKQDFRDFEVIVADDGSTDNPVEVCQEFSNRLNISYCWQKHDGYRLTFVRNMGAKMAKGEALLFLDSDVMLNPAALSHYNNHHTMNPEAIISGRYDWMKPMDFSVEDVYNPENWEKIIKEEMPSLSMGELKGIIGPDPRAKTYPDGPYFNDKIRDHFCMDLFGGNLLIPAKVYWAVGGQDENMVGHGGEDCELGMRLQEAGYKAIFTEKTIGYHIYHDRNQQRNTEEVIKNIAYLEAKHKDFMIKVGMVKGNIEGGESPLIIKPEDANTA